MLTDSQICVDFKVHHNELQQFLRKNVNQIAEHYNITEDDVSMCFAKSAILLDGDEAAHAPYMSRVVMAIESIQDVNTKASLKRIFLAAYNRKPEEFTGNSIIYNNISDVIISE